MAEEIINRVASSNLVTLDLEDYYPEGERVLLDIREWLHEGIILKEKDFRTFVTGHNWEQYRDAYVGLYCSSEAIIPGWAYMLVSTKLQPFAKKVVLGDLELLETVIFQSVIEQLELAPFQDKPVVIKGCTKKPVPKNAYIWATFKLQGVAKSIMYGEACSSVPLFKKK